MDRSHIYQKIHKLILEEPFQAEKVIELCKKHEIELYNLRSWYNVQNKSNKIHKLIYESYERSYRIKKIGDKLIPFGEKIDILYEKIKLNVRFVIGK